MAKHIPLTQGRRAVVDDADFAWLSQWKWTYSPGRRTGYAYRARPEGQPGPRHILMHRLILGLDGVSHRVAEVDHRDRDGLNNRRANLRRIDHGGNQRNTAPRSALGEKGVRRQWHRWQAYATVDGRYVHLGMYGSREEARAARRAFEEQFEP